MKEHFLYTWGIIISQKLPDVKEILLHSAEPQMRDSRGKIVLGSVKRKWQLKVCWEVMTEFFVFKNLNKCNI